MRFVRTANIAETPIIPSKRPKTAVGKSRAYVTALARGLSVMKAFNEQHASLTLSDVARIVGLPRASARRALLTLQSLGYVESNGRMFSLSPQVLTLARAYLASSPVPRVAQGFLENLSEGLGESCSLSILHGDEVIYIARSTRKRIGSLHRDVGAHLPAHCTSMGRVLLAALPDAHLTAFIAATKLDSFTPYTTIDKDELRDIMQKVRRNGYSLVDQELEIELRSIAVPVHDAGGRVIAAMNVSAQASRTTKKQMVDRFLPALRDAAMKMRPLLIG
ncbi:MAG: IclR family transcriptional regulator, pca regulon regulatory protein [Alphaproteobacteria bacterium]|jgi:IclR family pca regulon transcriptional regulator|nr:IclR family transcriptional regulator, pca regulon regulatory protein [Alphaproteobacteria bacterium]